MLTYLLWLATLLLVDNSSLHASIITSSIQFAFTVVRYLPKNGILTLYTRFAYCTFVTRLSGRILQRIYKNYVLSTHSPLSACTSVAHPWVDNTYCTVYDMHLNNAHHSIGCPTTLAHHCLAGTQGVGVGVLPLRRGIRNPSGPAHKREQLHA